MYQEARKLVELKPLPDRRLIENVERFGVEPGEIGIKKRIWLNTDG